MRLLLLRSLWTNGYNIDAALADCHDGLYDGLEGPVPSELNARREFRAKVRDAGVPFVAEITTGGGYLPDPELKPDFLRKAQAALECAPLFLTALAGSDAWPTSKNVDFLGRAIQAADDLGTPVTFETHRGRALCSPWAARDLLFQLESLRLTCDFSHWCCACERFVLDSEPELLALCAQRADHIHARVGYEQGPQVPQAHERWWNTIWSAPERANRGFTTVTPEFGPDGYLHAIPFTQTPVASLDEVNHWMAQRLRQRFSGHPLAAAA
jgi:sugar phosphate isomerase/epimerase